MHSQKVQCHQACLFTNISLVRWQMAEDLGWDPEVTKLKPGIAAHAIRSHSPSGGPSCLDMRVPLSALSDLMRSQLFTPRSSSHHACSWRPVLMKIDKTAHTLPNSSYPVWDGTDACGPLVAFIPVLLGCVLQKSAAQLITHMCALCAGFSCHTCPYDRSCTGIFPQHRRSLTDLYLNF